MNFLHRPTLVVLGITLLGMLVYSGCNTARGFGRDVESAGEHIQRAAR
jgi:predicted small secreted protein